MYQTGTTPSYCLAFVALYFPLNGLPLAQSSLFWLKVNRRKSQISAVVARDSHCIRVDSFIDPRTTRDSVRMILKSRGDGQIISGKRRSGGCAIIIRRTKTKIENKELASSPIHRFHSTGDGRLMQCHQPAMLRAIAERTEAVDSMSLGTFYIAVLGTTPVPLTCSNSPIRGCGYANP
ncbi:hypothetical protein M413DRAFT_354771 [Hebeloma cylindrosporum]|uniref:Uncharacterized protein n=1 Tax=Hebeloma cylindrosporum TaxID=76867 RepID=A0A0C2Y3T3_HEBCY|nr:hypothetical protein M413DRAFT_354771 [Hebeloma cylindrosporum h7]